MKNVLSMFLLSCVCFIGYSQEGYYDENLSSNVYTASQVIGNTTVQPPDVAAFQKVNFIPVSNYTGRANISIPIYQVSAGSMSVPISLSYNSSGVKVSDMASSVGLNWSLNAGGMISRMIKGMDDFHTPHEIPLANRMSPSGWLGYEHPNIPQNHAGENLYNDAEPDLFIANAPGLSMRYIHKKNADPIGLEQQGNIINETIGLVTKNYLNDYTGTYNNITFFGLENVDITSTSGIIYSFASPDASRHHGSPGGSGSMYKIESYRLDKMFDPSTNQTIDFEYEQYSNYFYDEILSKPISYNGGTGLNFGNSIKYNVYPVTQRLKKIVFDKGSVEFIYGLTRLDNTGDKVLSEIKVKDTNGNIIKHTKLEHSYFQSSIASNTPQSKRLRLDKVYEVDTNLNELPGHTFTYNTSLQMPPRGSYAHDFLGYNNGSYSSSNTNPIPKYYFNYNYSFPNNHSYRLTPFYNASDIAITGNYSLEANVNYAKTYSLTKITFPTGGYNEYEYELNEFSYYGTRKGAGLRIKSQKLDDSKGNQQILDYTYSTGSIVKMPVFAVFDNNGLRTSITSLSQIGGMDTFMTPQSQVEFTQGAFVGYGNVTVKSRIDNGYTEYNYTSPSSYGNTPSTKIVTNTNGNSQNWSVFGAPALSLDNDYLRGKISSEIVYTKSGKKRIEKTYNYTQKEFSTISLEHLNKSENQPQNNCYNPSGSYKLDIGDCGGYWEELDLVIARDLLTTVTIRDYQSDKISSSGLALNDMQYTFKTTQTYLHDKQYPLVTNESKSVTICEATTQGGEQNCQNVYDDYTNTSMSKEVIYPIEGGNTMQSNEISTLPYANELVQQNRLAMPMNIKYNGVNLNEEKHQYKNFGYNIIALEKINFKARDASITPSDKVTKRDAKGRVIEYLKPNGIYVANIYGYDDMYLVAEVINNTYANTISTLQNDILTPFNQGTFSNDSSIRTIMNELRDELPNAQITSYTYKHLVGVNSITDVRRQTVNYHYGSFNRLESITDVDGKVISKNKYHYKNQ